MDITSETKTQYAVARQGKRLRWRDRRVPNQETKLTLFLLAGLPSWRNHIHDTCMLRFTVRKILLVGAWPAQARSLGRRPRLPCVAGERRHPCYRNYCQKNNVKQCKGLCPRRVAGFHKSRRVGLKTANQNYHEIASHRFNARGTAAAVVDDVDGQQQWCLFLTKPTMVVKSSFLVWFIACEAKSVL